MMTGVASIALRSLALVVVAYCAFWALVHLLTTVAGVLARRRWSGQPRTGEEIPLTVAVPAYNEVDTVAAALAALLEQSYPLSVVFVDDGSTDGTFEAVADRYELVAVDTERDVERFEAVDRPLSVVRQPNAGKSAALNAVLESCETPLFGVVDADTVLEPGSVAALAEPFADDATVAAGGSFRVTDAASVSDGSGSAALPRSWFQRFQALDQLRAFVFRQLGRASVGCMILVFGACSLYRTELVRDAGGFDDVETEDFELAVQLLRHCAEVERPCDFVQVPDAVAWTTVPSTAAGLDEQRRRWIRGATETLARHRSLVGRPEYGRAGVLGLPYFLLGEIVWPIVETVGYVVVPIAWLAGAISTSVLAVFAAGLVVAGPLSSAVAVFATRWDTEGYRSGDRRSLLAASVVERVVWRPLQALLGTSSVIDYFR